MNQVCRVRLRAMEKKLFAVCVILCLDLVMFVALHDKLMAKDIPVTTTFYENMIAITFDDGPGPYTEELLDGLKEQGVKATFFVLGGRIEGNEDIIKRMQDEGHLIGNHTYSHVQLSTVNPQAACDEVRRTNDAVEAVTGVRPQYIRPPYGSYNAELECQIDMTEVLWSLDPRDWDTTNVDEIVNTVVKNAKDGDIILLHDIYSSSVAAALRIVEELKAKGFVFVTVDEILIK